MAKKDIFKYIPQVEIIENFEKNKKVDINDKDRNNKQDKQS